jgi:probable HAF family extracellular repeat protein
MKTLKIAVVVWTGLLASSLAYSQVIFSPVKIATSSPNSLISINNAGQVVVNTGTSDSYQVSSWNRVSGADPLDLVGTNSGGADINSSGDIVGAGDPDHSGVLQAFMWQPLIGTQWLGSLGGRLSAASGINDSKAVVGMSYTAAYNQHAFLWTAANGMQDITPTLTSLGGATGVGINASNQVVGYYYPDGALNTLGFLWSQAGGLQNIGDPGTLAFAISDSGMVVGQTTLASGFRHAFSWTSSGGMTDLGVLGGAGESSALNINGLGWIVGTSTNSANSFFHGFLWTPTSGMQDLATLAGLSVAIQVTSVQANDAGVIAMSTNKGGYLLVPKMTATFSSSVNPSVVGQPVTFTATLTTMLGPPPDGELVQFVASGTVLGSAPLTNGVAQLTSSAIPVGSHVVVANYPGDANHLPAKYTALTQVVNK